MKEQFDKELRNHIKDTFGGFDDHLADDGWRKLNDRKKKKRRAFIFWYILPSGIAASLALFLLLNQSIDIPFQNGKIEEKTETTGKQNPNIGSNKVDDEKSNLEKKIDGALDNSSDLLSTKPQNAKAKKLNVNVKKQKGESIASSYSNTKIADLASSSLSSKKDRLTVNLSKNNQVDYIDAEEKVKTPISAQESDLIISNNTNYIVDRVQEISTQEKAFTVPINNSKQDITSKSLEQPKESYQKLAVLNQAKADTKNKKPIQNSKKFKIGIDANTYVNFSENGINDKINLGLGIISEIKLSKQLSINTGIALNGQNSTFNGNQKTNQDFSNASFAISSLAVVPNAQITNAKLVGLDIPLNLKYAVKIGKTSGFISSGFSSYSLINEKYFNEYSVINYSFTGVSTSRVSNVTDNPSGKFSYFKFARTLDISFGILYPLSKKSSLSIEPFMKYPLSGLGYQDLKIGSSGLSFKINFGQ